MLLPLSSIARIASTRSPGIGGRPRLGGRPRRLVVRCKSARTRATIIALSNSLNTASIWNSMRPEGVGVERLLVQEQVNTAGLEFTEQVDEIGQRPAESVHDPGGDQIEVLAGHTPHQCVKDGTVIAALGAGDALAGEHRHDGPTQALSYLVEVPALVLGGLPVSGGDTEVEGDASAHGTRIS